MKVFTLELAGVQDEHPPIAKCDVIKIGTEMFAFLPTPPPMIISKLEAVNDGMRLPVTFADFAEFFHPEDRERLGAFLFNRRNGVGERDIRGLMELIIKATMAPDTTPHTVVDGEGGMGDPLDESSPGAPSRSPGEMTSTESSSRQDHPSNGRPSLSVVDSPGSARNSTRSSGRATPKRRKTESDDYAQT